MRLVLRNARPTRTAGSRVTTQLDGQVRPIVRRGLTDRAADRVTVLHPRERQDVVDGPAISTERRYRSQCGGGGARYVRTFVTNPLQLNSGVIRTATLR